MITFKWKTPKTALFDKDKAKEYFKTKKPYFFNMIMPTLQRGVIQMAPVGATGLLRKSFVITYGNRSKLTSELEYASAVNDGRRAAPVALSAKEGIIKWLRLSAAGQDFYAALKSSYKKMTYERAAFILMRAKKKKPTKGQKFFEYGLLSVDREVQAISAKMLAEITKGITT